MKASPTPTVAVPTPPTPAPTSFPPRTQKTNQPPTNLSDRIIKHVNETLGNTTSAVTIQQQYTTLLGEMARTSTTARHRARQMALLPLLTLPPQRLEEAMTQLFSTNSTRLTVVGALIGLESRLPHCHLRAELKCLARHFKKRVQDPRWTDLVTPTDAAKVHLQFKESPVETRRILLAAMIAWCQGCRIGDILRVKTCHLDLNKLTMTLTDHKTSLSIGPYTVHYTQQIAEWIALADLPVPASTYVFFPTDSDVTDTMIASRHKKLKSICPTLKTMDLRGLRRGGLCNASEAADQDSELRTLSAHTSDPALRTYLQAGKRSAATKRTQHRLIAHNVARMINPGGPIAPAGSPSTSGRKP